MRQQFGDGHFFLFEKLDYSSTIPVRQGFEDGIHHEEMLVSR